MQRLRDLAQFDLNLLIVFRALDETRHVTRAAKILGISQPALSHALARLRDATGDPLFVKSSQGMVPTARATTLAPQIREILEGVSVAMLGPTEMNPKTLERTFTVRATDMLEALLLPRLIDKFGADAPGVRVAAMSTGFALPKSDLESGATDLAIAGFFGELPDGFFQQKLFTDDFTSAVRKKHPRLGSGRRPTAAQFAAERHVLISPGGELTGNVDRALKKAKLTRHVAVGVSTFLVSGWMAKETDCVLTAPSRLVALLSEALPLTTFTPPIELAPVSVVQVWHARVHTDPAHRWFRESVRQVLQD